MGEPNEIVVLPAVETVVEERREEPIELGQWFWVKPKAKPRPVDDDDWDDEPSEEELRCVTQVGSNYVELTNASEREIRVHLDEFQDRCRRERNAKQVIAGRVAMRQDAVRGLLAEVESVMARLGMGDTARLGAGVSEGNALARLDPNMDANVYKNSLIHAKEKELPELFKQIESTSRSLAMWMKAETIPLLAQSGQLERSTAKINDRIFTVELYAGLSEQVERVKDGKPAEMTEKIRIMQRRCYMDEECLARYETGGMEFKNLKAFDRWLARPGNFERILPFPRCIVAFRVRRFEKYREITSLISLFRSIEDAKWDEMTFLYIRNGEQLYRMNTSLEFGAHLFPDSQHYNLTSGAKLWAEVDWHGRVDEVITDDQFQGLVEDWNAKKLEHDRKEADHKVEHAAWVAAKKAAKLAGEKFTESEPWFQHYLPKHPSKEYQLFEPGNIYYDDIQRKIAGEIQQYNRIGIIVQGLLDRSMVLHPHPPWKIWSSGSAEQALELIYDATRALVAGEKPDFEAYRQRLNATLKAGTITIGQHSAWLAEGHEEDNHGRKKRDNRHYGDHGPAKLARLESYNPRTGMCHYAWYREGQGRETYGKQIRVKFSCHVSKVLNVEAYQPGDFRQFYEDPRTRSEYLGWAPFLLECEEYHAGNRKKEIGEPPPPAKRSYSHDGHLAYERRRRRQMLMGKMVTLARDVTMRNGTVYKQYTYWVVTSSERCGLTIHQISSEGKSMKGVIRCMEPRDLVLLGDAPDPAKDKDGD